MYYLIAQNIIILLKKHKSPWCLWQPCFILLNPVGSCQESPLHSLLSAEKSSLFHLSVSTSLGLMCNPCLRGWLRDKANAWSPPGLRQLQLSFCTLDSQIDRLTVSKALCGRQTREMKKTVKRSGAHSEVRALRRTPGLVIVQRLRTRGVF